MREEWELKAYISECKNKIINHKEEIEMQKRNLKQYQKELNNLKKGRK
jgi:hypothetical protein